VKVKRFFGKLEC